MRGTKQPAKVISQGTVSNGRRIFYVTSQSDPEACYGVVEYPHSLRCNCKAAQHNRECAHVKAVRAKIEADKTAQARRVDAASERTPQHPGDNAPLYRDNKPFSLFKS